MRNQSERCWDRQLNEITMERCVELYADESYRVIRHTELDGCEIYTVWKGISISNRIPLVFATAIFDPPANDPSGPLPLDPVIHRSEMSAKIFHEIMVCRLTEGRPLYG